MKRLILIAVAAFVASCSTTKNETVISPYSGKTPAPGQSMLVYCLPHTRLFFDVEISKTIIRKGPYSEYAGRMLGLRNVPAKNTESWQIKSINITSRYEVDGKQMYTLFFTDYPQNIDRLMNFTNAGIILDLTVSNMLTGRSNINLNEDLSLVNTVVRNTSVEKFDTVSQHHKADTSFMRIPVRKTVSKTTEELAREAAEQIFDIRKWRTDILRGDVEHPTDGEAFKIVMRTLDRQEEQLLSLFAGVRIETRQTVTYSAIPERPGTAVDLFYFSDRNGIVNKTAAGAKAVWYETGKVTVPASVSINVQAKDIIYYRIPPVVEVSAGLDRSTLQSELFTICQFGNIVSFPLFAPKK